MNSPIEDHPQTTRDPGAPGSTELTLRVLESIEEIGPWVGAWSSLLDRSPADSLFLTPEWHLSWLEAMGEEVAPRFVLGLDAQGTLRALLPLALRWIRVGPFKLRVAELSGEEMASGDHLGMIHDSSVADASWPEFGSRLRQLAGETDLLRFRAMDDGDTAAWLRSVARENSWPSLEAPPDVAPRAALPRDFDTYMASLSGPHRKEIRRLWRRLTASAPVQSALNEASRPLEAVLDGLVDLHVSLWKGRGRTGTLAAPRKREFLKKICRRSLNNGWLRLRQIDVGGHLAAAILVFHRKESAYYYQSGWDPSYASYKIGQAAVVDAMRGAIEEGISFFDFLRGDEAYKYRFANESIPLVGLDLATSAKGKAYLMARREWSMVKRTLGGRLLHRSG
jgi:CelD/BcsL family acetyltransferase involved in cellulose biosynthesis